MVFVDGLMSFFARRRKRAEIDLTVMMLFTFVHALAERY